MASTKKLLASIATAALLLGAPVAFAQTASTTTTGTGVTASTTSSGTTGTTDTTGTSATTPGAPNTGEGGDATTNMLLLAVSGLVVIAGGAYLARRAVTAQ